MNTRGDVDLGFVLTHYSWRFFLLFVCVFGIFFMFRHFMVLSVETESVRSELFFQRLLYSPTGITYADPLTGRPYPGIIDLEKASTPTLLKKYVENSILPSHPDLIAAELQLELADRKLPPFVYNEEDFTQWRDLLVAGTGVSVQKKTTVLVKTPRGLERGTLTAFIITPKG